MGGKRVRPDERKFNAEAARTQTCHLLGPRFSVEITLLSGEAIRRATSWTPHHAPLRVPLPVLGVGADHLDGPGNDLEALNSIQVQLAGKTPDY